MKKHVNKRSYKTLADRVISINDGIVTARLMVIGSRREVDITFNESVLSTDVASLNFSAQFKDGEYRIKATIASCSTKSGKTTVFLPRLILRPPANMVVDHINHDTLDNTFANMRVCTVRQNAQNRSGAASHSKTNVLGVSKNKRPAGGWTAAIVVDGTRIRLGRFDKLRDARNARIEAEKKYFGAYAPQR